MLPRNHPDRIQITFDDREASFHGGGPFQHERTGGTACTLGGRSRHRAPSWQLPVSVRRVSRELLARAWQAGAGPGDGPLTIDLDSTICETYGLAKEGARHHGYTGKRGYHPLLAIAAGTGDVLMSRLREGRANTARGAAHFLRETVGRVATPQRTTHATGRQRVLHSWRGIRRRKMDVRFSIMHNEAIPEDAWGFLTGWTAPPMWPRPPAPPSRPRRTPRRYGSSSGG